tara:strand:- start:84 stop:512 length:429 start_codon:yes stop_codon:yes gene_type:complete
MKKITAKSGLWFLLIIPIVIYVGWVINYEVNLGRNQPVRGNSIIIATYDDQDARHERVVSLRQLSNELYVSANHWPRAWYKQALRNPNVEVKLASADDFMKYTAVPLGGSEDERVKERFKPSLRSQLRMGFAPRQYLRLDPR